jgi:bud site selection protein 20
MGGAPRGRKSIHSAKKKFFSKSIRTKNRAKDLDQIHDEIATKRIRLEVEPMKDEATEIDEDLPAGGRFHCIETARYFVSQDAMDKHMKSKQFKNRIKQLKAEKYDQSVAERALGVTKEICKFFSFFFSKSLYSANSCRLHAWSPAQQKRKSGITSVFCLSLIADWGCIFIYFPVAN